MASGWGTSRGRGNYSHDSPYLERHGSWDEHGVNFEGIEETIEIECEDESEEDESEEGESGEIDGSESLSHTRADTIPTTYRRFRSRTPSWSRLVPSVRVRNREETAQDDRKRLTSNLSLPWPPNLSVKGTEKAKADGMSELALHSGSESHIDEEHTMAAFRVNLSPLREYLAVEGIESVEELLETLTFTVSQHGDCIALECREYIQHTWGKFGDFLARPFFDCVLSGSSNFEIFTEDDFPVTIFISKDLATGTTNAKVEVIGHSSFLTKIGDILSWISSTMTISTQGSYIYTTASTQKDAMSDWLYVSPFTIPSEPLGSKGPPPDRCWSKALNRTIIAHGFPVPARDRFAKGLEIAFDALLGICGIENALLREGYIIFVGLSTLLVPTRILEAGSVQWHLITAPGPELMRIFDGLQEKISLFVALGFNPNPDDQAMAESEISLLKDDLRKRRHFLGWTSEVQIVIGTREARYPFQGYTGTKEKATSKIADTDTFSAGIPGKGFSRFPLPGAISSANREARYDEELDNHRGDQILLYDPEEKRGWLVPYHSVLLHMVLHRAFLNRRLRPESRDIPYAASYDGEESAMKVLGTQRTVSLLPGQEDGRRENQSAFEDYTLGDSVRQMIYRIYNVHPTPSITKFGAKETLLGYEFLDLIKGNYRMKQDSIPSHGGWSVLTRDVPVVLFCSGLGDVLRPVNSGHQLCPRWKTLPMGAYLLGAPRSGLRSLAKSNGSGNERQHLVQGYVWCSSTDGMEHSCTSEETGCNQSLSKIRKARWVADDEAVNEDSMSSEPRGAVVFGDAKCLSKVLSNVNTRFLSLNFISPDFQTILSGKLKSGPMVVVALTLHRNAPPIHCQY
ncbi:hypothetical protein P152DRAFT_513073 [Eremomyces bilateralis CBS 781.70]|uniref:Uncharacterized protein n=1 Tax=Eremomyces bilateralis CBS 781.70 TaxID=1392243 RepID=A0A6G1G701_9PEZI|nr:uncharacterized protein P152DRAFT_513073 [Eremomyces bilateralis CBS 781.70]KAF1813670.1 hypothetical protein P152DRAFT_513073 [Eremomyces bilateralis CBS 781.70]